MNIGIIGSGGREHALCLKLKESDLVNKIYCFPGNAGTELLAENIDINIDDFNEIKKKSLEKNISLLVVGPEKQLVNGIVDFLKILVFKCLVQIKFHLNSKVQNFYKKTL